MTKSFRIVAFLFIALVTGVVAQEKISVEWIYSGQSGALTAMPSFKWLDDGTALLYDRQIPAAERTIERLDPRTGNRTPALDREETMAELHRILGMNNAPEAPLWPAEITSSGKSALYIFEGDLYLLNFESSKITQVTKTKAEEKSARFSPDGGKLAFVRQNDLFVYDLSQKSETRLTWDGSETTLNGTLSWVYWEEIFGRQDLGYWWSDDSKSIAYLQTDESNVAVSHFVHFRPATPEVITQRYPKSGTENPKVRVGVVRAKGGETVWSELKPYDYEYIARVKWLPDNRRYALQTLTRDVQTLNLYFIDAAAGGAEHVFTETDPGWINIHDDLYFLKNGKHFIWQSERNGYAHLYRYSMDGELVNQITKGDWAVRSASGGVFWLRQAVQAIDEKSGWVYFTALEKSSVEKHLYRIKMNGSQMQRLSAEDGTHFIAFSPPGEYYFDRFSTLSNAPSLRLHKKDGTLVQGVSNSNTEALAKLDLQAPELLNIPASDGFQMPAKILKPANFDPNKKYPLILYVYGGPSAPTVANAWQSRNYYFDQMLLDRGFLVAGVDNRSATAISKKLENTILRQMSSDGELNDLVDAVRWLKKQSYIDPDRVGVWGWSGGGTFTMLAMTRSKEFKAGVAVAGVTDWDFYDTKWAETVMKTQQENRDGYNKTSLLQYAKNLHGRLLLVHGTYDDNVHPQHSWSFINELIAANKRFEMMFYPMRKHSISDSSARIHLYNTMLEFWKRNL